MGQNGQDAYSDVADVQKTAGMSDLSHVEDMVQTVSLATLTKIRPKSN